MLKDYYALAKPGLVYGNIIPVIGGFALAARAIGEPIGFLPLAATIIGISFIMASGCVFNNYIDRDIDDAMARTKNRALVAGRISNSAAIIYGIVLGAIGFATLAIFTNWLTFIIAAFGFFAYVVLYSLLGKRSSIHGPLIGSLAGAVPPVVGYCAASDRFDAGAIILFAILVFWQMPHFYAIAIYRFDDYASAKVPVLPIKKGIRATKIQMLAYIIAFTIAALSLTTFGYTGDVYATIVAILGIAWLILCIKGFWIDDHGAFASPANKRWARKMFFLSLIIMVTLFLTITIGAIR